MKLFRREKKEADLMEPGETGSNYMIKDACQFTAQATNLPIPQPIVLSDDKTARLMQLISFAIEEWAKEYHLENMPKKIIFEQALDAMRAIEITWNNKAR